MDLPDLQSQPLWAAVACYLGAALIVWTAGTRLARYADAIATRTGIGGGTVGVVLLGLVTSLPEIATSVTAALSDKPALGVNNLLGSTSWQFVVLAAADAVYGRRAITASVPKPSVMLQAVILIILLTLAVGGTMAGDVGLFGVGAWSAGILAAYVLGVAAIGSGERRRSWVPGGAAEPGRRPPRSPKGDPDASPLAGTAWALAGKTSAVAAVILVAGVVLTLSSEAVAMQTGLDTGLAGLTLLAAATSLPELSSAVAAVKLGRSEMAIGDIIGGNMANTALIFLVDLAYDGGPVLNQVDRVATVAAMLGILLTCFFLVGMIERRDKTILKMGYDSVAVLLTYAGGVGLLFWMTVQGSD